MKLPAKRIRRGEQGQTILLVAVSIVALLSMAALAIDVVTLYVAKSEIQRAADAIALAGAKAIADSGVTTVPTGDPSLTAAETLAGTMSSAAITAALSANTVNGSPPALVGGMPAPNWSKGNNNPYITVTVQQTNLPTFFAKIWARATASTQATATAEVYNPINPAQAGTPMIANQCVKPWLMANGNPFVVNSLSGTLGQLIDPSTGNLLPAAAQILNNPFYLTADCNSGLTGCQPVVPNPNFQPTVPNGAPPYPAVYYLPASIGTTGGVYPACAAALQPFAQSVAGCDSTVYVCGGGNVNATWDPGENPARGTVGAQGTDANSDTALGAECLLGLAQGGTGPEGSGAGLDQDTLGYPGGWPAGAPTITMNRAPQNGSVVSTSNSIVTIPIIDSSQPLNNHPPVTVIGFLQAFINFVGYDTGSGQTYQDYGDINVTVMNVVGCGQDINGSPPVAGANATCSSSTGQCPGGGNTTIPVRLITTPTT